MSRTGQLPNNINPQIQSPMHAVLLWAGPNYFVPYQKLIYIVSQFETFCARPKNYFHIVNLVLVPAQNFLRGTNIQFNFWSDPKYLDRHKTFWVL